jgi:hypothetical protein
MTVVNTTKEPTLSPQLHTIAIPVPVRCTLIFFSQFPTSLRRMFLRFKAGTTKDAPTQTKLHVQKGDQIVQTHRGVKMNQKSLLSMALFTTNWGFKTARSGGGAKLLKSWIRIRRWSCTNIGRIHNTGKSNIIVERN